MKSTLYLMIALVLMTNTVVAKPIAKPMATAIHIPAEQYSFAKQLKKIDEKNQEFDWDVNDFTNSWQLYLITNPKFEPVKDYEWLTDKPIGVRFTDDNFYSINTCSKITGTYRLSTMDKGFIIVDKTKIQHKSCSYLTPEQILNQEQLVTEFVDSFANIIPVTIEGKKERILKLQTENYNYIFRQLKNKH